MNTKNIRVAFLLLSSIICLSSCEDQIDEITTLNVTRAFSPTGLTTAIVNKTDVRLSWNAVKNASTYTVEVFETADFSGTPVKSVSGITIAQVPYTITGLGGDTQYAIRVKAVGEGVSDSKWMNATAKTDAEQILSAINPAKLTFNSVALNWPAGQTATAITLTPGNITRPVTAAEIAAGEAIVTGLTGETTYTAKLMNGTKTRGTVSFTTPLDLGGATAVNPGANLVTLFANATEGQVFALFPGTYDVNADVVISKSISIKGAKPSDKPIIKGMVVRLKANAGLTLKDLNIDGTGALNGNQLVIYDEALDNAYGNLLLEGNIIKNYVKGLVYVNVKALIESAIFRGNLISNIECNGGDFIDFRTGLAKTVNFSNNTVYNSAAARDLFRMDPAGSTNFPAFTSVITIATNTFNGVCNGAANRILYVRLAKHEIYFTKNIVANSGGILTNQASTNIVGANFSGNNYFNSPTYISGSATANAKYDTGSPTTLNPGFTDAANGNFTISQQDLKTNGVGDPRWR